MQCCMMGPRNLWGTQLCSVWLTPAFLCVLFVRCSCHFVFLRTAIWLRYQVASGGVRHGLGGSPKCRLAPPPWNIQESGGELSEICKCWSFLLSKYVNNVYKLLRLLGDFIPRPPTGGSPLNSSPLEMKIPGAASASSKVWSLSWRHLVACLPFLQTKSQRKDQDQSMLQCQLRDRPNN